MSVKKIACCTDFSENAETAFGLVFFGSVAKRLAHKAPCSVMIVRQRKGV